MGYHLAGFDVVGVDIEPQPHYPFEFHQADALEYALEHGREFDAIHASPPCQAFSVCTSVEYRGNHPMLICATRIVLRHLGLPYVIENVENARRWLENPVKLCGSMFGLKVWRHRYFEVYPECGILVPPCDHSGIPVLISGSPRRNGCRKEPNAQMRRDAMETPWMTIHEMDEAIPPAYTEFLGRQMMPYIADSTQVLQVV